MKSEVGECVSLTGGCVAILNLHSNEFCLDVIYNVTLHYMSVLYSNDSIKLGFSHIFLYIPLGNLSLVLAIFQN